MNKTILTSIIIILVAVIGVMAFTSGGDNSDVVNDTSTTSQKITDQSNDQDNETNDTTGINSNNGDANNIDEADPGNVTYTNSEFGFSFAYPEKTTVRSPGYEGLYDDPDHDVVNWVELPETYDHPTRSNAQVHYKILIKEGVHEPSVPGPTYERFTSVQSSQNQSFTIQYEGPSSDYPESVEDAFSTVSESFEIQ